jgi:acyl transferase domain-containing protein
VRTRPAISELSEPLALCRPTARFPGASVAGLCMPLASVLAGLDAATEIPSARWSLEENYEPASGAEAAYGTKHGAFIEGADLFDPKHFSISAHEAEAMDPQQRLLLELASESLHPQDKNNKDGRIIGVVVGAGAAAWAHRKCSTGALSPFDGTGLSPALQSGRISFIFGLLGPSISVDTACSSSLVALKLGSCYLKHDRCDACLVASCDLLVDPRCLLLRSAARMLSPVGRCKTFDASADGYLRAEGCGAVKVCLPNSDSNFTEGADAVAILRGTAVNQDGRSVTQTAPNGT